MAKSQKWPAWCRGYEFQHFPPILIFHVLHNIPKHLHAWVFQAIVTDHICATIKRIASKIVDINPGGGTTNESLKFRLIEHTQPRWLNNVSKSSKKHSCLLRGLSG